MHTVLQQRLVCMSGVEGDGKQWDCKGTLQSMHSQSAHNSAVCGMHAAGYQVGLPAKNGRQQAACSMRVLFMLRAQPFAEQLRSHQMPVWTAGDASDSDSNWADHSRLCPVGGVWQQQQQCVVCARPLGPVQKSCLHHFFGGRGCHRSSVISPVFFWKQGCQVRTRGREGCCRVSKAHRESPRPGTTQRCAAVPAADSPACCAAIE